MKNLAEDKDKNRRRLLEILRHNVGFDNPEKWLDYAQKHSFKRRKAYYRPECPECDADESEIIGQYVHFSQLVRLRKCKLCGLVYSDVLLEPNFVRDYFEDAYKEETYFVEQRKLIFEHVSQIISSVVKSSEPFDVIDIGGAKGHLSHLIRSHFPNAKLTLNDISREACKYAARTFSLETICCDLKGLKRLRKKYRVVLLIDVLYYVRDVKDAWRTVKELMEDEGILVIRVPNKLPWIIFWQKTRKLITSENKQEMQDKITGINPEHIRFFSVKYLKNRINRLGLHAFTVHPSPPLVPLHPFKKTLVKFLWAVAVLLYKLSNGKLIVTPSIIITARK